MPLSFHLGEVKHVLRRHLLKLASRSPCLLVVLVAAQAKAVDLYVAPDGHDDHPGTAAMPFKPSGKASHVTTSGSTVLVFNNANGGIVVGAGDSPSFDDPSKPADDIIVINNIVYDNGGIGIEESGITGMNNVYANNSVFANQQDWELDNGLSHSGTVTAPPGFVRYDPDGRDDKNHLKADSPAIDRGTSMEAPTDDYDGVPRPQGRGIDIGPLEFVP